MVPKRLGTELASSDVVVSLSHWGLPPALHNRSLCRGCLPPKDGKSFNSRGSKAAQGAACEQTARAASALFL